MQLEPLNFSNAVIERGGEFTPDFQRWLSKIQLLFGDPRQSPRYALFDHYADIGNVGTGEDDLYSDSIVKGQLRNNGDKIVADYTGTYAASGTATRKLKVYFGGTLIFDSGALTTAAAQTWRVLVQIIRESSTVVRCTITEIGAILSASTYTRITGLILADAQILKLTGEAAGVGAATNDIIAKLGSIEYEQAA